MFRLFENLVDPFAAGEQANIPPVRLWSWMLDCSKPFRRVFLLAGLVSVLVAAVEIGLIHYMGRIVDLLSGSPVEIWRQHGTELIFIAGFVLLPRPALYILHVLLLNNTILPNFGTLVRWRAHKHVLRQSVCWFENESAGRITNRVMQTPTAAGEAVFQVFDAISFSLAYLIGAVVLLMAADPRLSLPLLAWLVLYALLVRWTMKRVGPASRATADARSTLAGRVVDTYTNIHSVKMFPYVEYESDHVREAIAKTHHAYRMEMRNFTVMDAALVILNGLLIVSVVGWAIVLWMQGGATAGLVAAATALTLRLNAMTGWIMWALTNFFCQIGVVAEGLETLARPIDLLDAKDAKLLQLTGGRIDIHDLSHHHGRKIGGLDHVNLTILPGEKIGLVGRSGAGKSTLLKLLLRFHEVERGAIMIDGQDISQVTQDSLRGQIGMVLQENALLHRSVRDNILYGRPDATEKQVIRAAVQAGADEFISGLRDPEGRTGYDAHVGERGVKLSGGQRQRVALARVILEDAPILLLDEATSALDSDTEAAIQQTLYDMMQGKTVIAIAHRLGTIVRMDRILVMEKGRIVEQGTHSDLLALGGIYAGFWERQSKGFLYPEIDE